MIFLTRHVLVVGGTGMLADVAIWLSDVQGFQVSVMGRNKSRLEALKRKVKNPNSIHPISVDYHDLNKLSNETSNIISLRGPIGLSVTWIHYTSPDSLKTIGDEISKKTQRNWRLFNIRGGTQHIPRDPIGVPENCLYRQVLLGFIFEGFESRWLTDHEIANGVIQAIKSDHEESIIGLIKPWDKRPSTLVNKYSV